jgi:predicted metal-binding membrane protein
MVERVEVRAYERGVWIVALLVSAVCWVLTVGSAQNMAGGMPMPGGWVMSMGWMVMPGHSVAAAAVMFLGMWDVMMVAMMLPSVLPVVLLYRGLVRSRKSREIPVVPETVLLAGYFIVWTAFGLVAFAVGLWFAGLTMRSDGLSRLAPALSGVALTMAGVYQVTPLKRSCLNHCRSPLSFFSSSWREGWIGALRLGAHHGAYCIACCWALMVVQMVIGVMNVWMMVLIAGVIAIEKSWKHGERFAVAAGLVTVTVGALHIAAALGRV